MPPYVSPSFRAAAKWPRNPGVTLSTNAFSSGFLIAGRSVCLLPA